MNVEKVKKVKAEKPPVELDPQFAKAMRDFINAKGLKRPATIEWYERVLRYFGEFLAEQGLEQWPVDPDSVNAFTAHLRRDGRKDGTISNYFRAIRSWLNWLAKRKRVDKDIVEMLETPPRSKPLPKAVAEGDLARFLAELDQACKTDWRACRDRALLTLALASGARIGELSGLKLDQLDLAGCSFTATGTKTGSDRLVVFDPGTAKVQAAWLEVRAGLDIPDDVDAVFVGKSNGTPWQHLTESGMRCVLEKWQDKAGVERFNFHRLRHSHALYFLRSGGDILDLQKNLGHGNLATTAIYTQINNAGRAERAARHSPINYLYGAAQ